MLRRRIKKANVKFISLVPKGANMLPVLYKEADQGAEFRALSKLDEDRGELLAVVYAPEIRDSQGDIASAEVIKQMAYDAAKDGVEIDIRHDGKPVGKDRAYIAEKFIVQKGDARFADFKDYQGRPVDVAGGWAVVVKIEDPALKKLYREGAWNGVSLFGPAEVEIEKSQADVDSLVDDLARRIKERDMLTAEALKKILDERDAALLAKIAETVKGSPAPTQAPKPEDVKKGDEFDPLDVTAVEQRLAKLERERLAKEVDWSDPDSVRAYRDALKGGANLAETAEQKASRLEKEAADLKAKVAKLSKASNAPVDPKAPETTLTKEEQEIQAGLEMAKMANARRGYAA
ncbi:MAG: XkdF-like putative serine protease domain-containing protein [Burkholderiales bacterium]|nr:XkdF-like putative serine protease domain-containing protein [Burkholderiales bacterium]